MPGVYESRIKNLGKKKLIKDRLKSLDEDHKPGFKFEKHDGWYYMTDTKMVESLISWLKYHGFELQKHEKGKYLELVRKRISSGENFVFRFGILMYYIKGTFVIHFMDDEMRKDKRGVEAQFNDGVNFKKVRKKLYYSGII